MLNDLVVFDLKRMQMVDHMMFSEAALGRRMYHTGFKIDDSVFSIGGQGKDGAIFNSFLEIKIRERQPSEARVDRGRHLLDKIYLSAITPVFYQSKMGQDGSLSLSNLAGEIDWGAAIELIKYEGFYMFGGRKETGEASN